MPRTKKIIDRIGPCEVVEQVRELYTLRQDLPDGRTIRHDGDCLWFVDGCSFYGTAPSEWDISKAVFDGFRRTFTIEADYS